MIGEDMLLLGIPLFKAALVCINDLIFTFLLVLMCEHYYAGNSLKSWSFVFYVLSFVWLLLRGTFWLLTVLVGRTWEAFEFYILYWVPVPMEICSFMLVPLFFVNILYPRKWSYYKIFIRPVYVVITCGLTALSIIWSLLAAVSIDTQHECIRNFVHEHKHRIGDDDAVLKTCFRTEYTGYLFRSITAVCFLFLSITQGLFGIKLRHVSDWYQIGLIPTQKHKLTYLNIFLCFSFISRVLYQVLAIFWDFEFANIPLDGSKDIPILLFLMIILWDYLPTIFLLLTVVSPSLQGGIFATRGRSGSRAMSMDDSIPYGRDRTESGFTSDGGDFYGPLSTEDALWPKVKRFLSSMGAQLGWLGLGNDSVNETGMNYNTDSDMRLPHVSYSGGDDGFHHSVLRGRNTGESASLLASGRLGGRSKYSNGGNRDKSKSPTTLDPLQRFQQAPVLPRQSNHNSYPYQSVGTFSGQKQGDFQTSNDVKYYDGNFAPHKAGSKQPQQRGQRQVPAPSLNYWAPNNSDVSFDPDLYAYSAVTRVRNSSHTSLDSFSPLDLQLQRDTSASSKFAGYAPYAPSTTTFNNFGNTFSTVETSAPNPTKRANPPSALDNALGAFKQNPRSMRVNSLSELSNSTAFDNLMSPSAMSHESPSNTPSDFTLTSRMTSTTSTSNKHHSSFQLPPIQSSHLHQQPVDKSNERVNLSSRPGMRSSSGNFLNLASLDQEDSEGSTTGTSGGGGRRSKGRNNSTTDSKSTTSSQLS